MMYRRGFRHIWPPHSRQYSNYIAAESKSVSNAQDLYYLDKSSPGSVFLLPKGAILFNKLISFMKAQQTVHGFQEVVTPLIYKNDLWKTSGHWQHYKKDMFEVRGESHGEEEHEDTKASHIYGLKPMNCPGHCLVFKSKDRSFRELPVRYSDFSPLHRNESSGALSGLTRVRKFHQDDGHIFCSTQHIESEIKACLNLIDTVYKVFGLTTYRLTLSTRPDDYIGDLSTWDRAEANLTNALNSTGQQWSVKEGDGAFYGPKIDIMVSDNNNKEHQAATIQLDFQLPKNFELEYTSSTQTQEQPVLIHRAVYGSLERFLALLIDHFQGNWPFWMSPFQAAVIPISTEKHLEYAQKVTGILSGKLSLDGQERQTAAELSARYFNVDIYSQAESVNKRIKNAIKAGYRYLIIVGDQEVQSTTISIRTKEEKSTTTMTPKDAFAMFCNLEDNYK